MALFDERAHAGAEHLDPAYVAAYDAKAGADPVDELALLRECGLRRETTLVDLGAGSGLLALATAPHCRRVVAVDPSPAMLALAQERAEAARLGNVEIAEAGFLSYEHRGDPPQLVHSRNALHHLPDFWKAVALEEHVRTEHSTFSWLLEPLLERTGFSIRSASHRQGAYSTYICVAV